MPTPSPDHRIEFDNATKLRLAGRVGYRCSNPDCRRLIIGPKSDFSDALKLGDAAHILPAKRNGPRGGRDLPIERIKDQNNGLWLCPACHQLVDGNPEGYPEDQLRRWKAQAEQTAADELTGLNRLYTSRLEYFPELLPELSAGLPPSSDFIPPRFPPALPTQPHLHWPRE